MLFPERRFGLVNNSNNLFDYLFSDPIFNVNVPNRISTDIKEKENGYELDMEVQREEAREEARYTIKLLSKYNVPVKYPIAIDTERTPPGNGRGDKISKQQRTKIVQAFLLCSIRLYHRPACFRKLRSCFKFIPRQGLNLSRNKFKTASKNFSMQPEYRTKFTTFA